MFKAFYEWMLRRRQENLKPLSRVSSVGLDTSLFEKTGVALSYARMEVLRNPATDQYWLSEYREQGFGQWEDLTSIDQRIGKNILQYPEMLSNFQNTREWITPNTDSIEHPARLNTKVTGSLGSKLFARLESVAIADHANGTQIMKDPLSEQYWLVVTKIENKLQWNDLTSLDHQISQAILDNPKMLSHYIETGEWVKSMG